jgi:Spy/CpxP family protein refolding chaperone
MKHILYIVLAFSTCVRADVNAWLHQGLVTPEVINSLKSELELSAEQQAKMQAIVEAAQAEGLSLEQAVKEAQKAFNGLLKNRETQAEAASTALTKLLEAESPLKHLQLHTLLQLRDVLTVEQQRLAAKLAPERKAKTAGLETQVRQKAMALREVVDGLGVKPTETMSERGKEIEGLIRSGDWAAANDALEQLIKDSGFNEPVTTEPLDFSKFETGDIDLEVLKQRYEQVQEKGQSVISIPMIRQFVQAKQAFEEAKEAQDAEKVGRILTWAEKQLENL